MWFDRPLRDYFPEQCLAPLVGVRSIRPFHVTTWAVVINLCLSIFNYTTNTMIVHTHDSYTGIIPISRTVLILAKYPILNKNKMILFNEISFSVDSKEIRSFVLKVV